MSAPVALAAGCSQLPCPGQHIEAFGVDDLNPLTWLGDAASAAVGDVWMAAMTGLWSAALWLLKLAFKIIDAFTTPDLSASGPMGAVLPTTLWLGATLAVIMMFVQLALALVRRDGESMGRIFLGVGQFGLVWVAYLGLAAGFVAAAAGLERGILQAMLNAPDLSHVDLTASFPNTVNDITLATVLGVLGLLIVIPASFAFVLIMFVREAALIILVATAPISAAGLVSDTGKVWFWKTLRWFFSCLLISPLAALILGVGVKLADGIIAPPSDSASQASSSAAHAGMAVVGCIVIAIGACCPMIVFRLLAFVEPGTASGAALRQSWSDAGGASGIMSGGKQASGSSAATQSGGDGRSGGESGAESQTQGRLSQAMGALGPIGTAFGTGMQAVSSIASKAADIGSDVLGRAGIGSPGYSPTPTDERSNRSGGNSGASSGGESSGGSSGGAPSVPEPPTPPTPPTPPMPGGGGGMPGPGGGGMPGGGGAGAAGGGAESAAVVAV